MRLSSSAPSLFLARLKSLYEGFLVLALRERVPANCQVRGVTMDPMGIWEFWEEVDSVLWARKP